MKMLVTGSDKGDIFFFECDGSQDLQKYESTFFNFYKWNFFDYS